MLKGSLSPCRWEPGRATHGCGPVTPGERMKLRLYQLAVTFAAVLTAIGHVGTNGAKWG